LRRSEALSALELSGDATPAEIKAAYRDLVKIWHPDRFGTDERLRRRAEERLQGINEAYRALESGTFDPEDLADAQSPADEVQPARSLARRDAALRAWVYLVIVVVLGAYVGYGLVEHHREQSATSAPGIATPVPIGAAPAQAPRETGDASGSARHSEDSVRITRLSEAQMERLDAACGGLAEGSQQYASCVQAEVSAMTGAPAPRSDGPAPDLSGLTEDERMSMNRVCSQAPSYGQCVTAQLAKLAAEPVRPDLARMNERDRGAIGRACSSPRDHDGPAAFDRCAAEFERMLTPHGN